MDVTVDDEFDYSDELFVANVNSFMTSITSLIALDELDSEVWSDRSQKCKTKKKYRSQGCNNLERVEVSAVLFFLRRIE